MTMQRYKPLAAAPRGVTSKRTVSTQKTMLSPQEAIRGAQKVAMDVVSKVNAGKRVTRTYGR